MKSGIRAKTTAISLLLSLALVISFVVAIIPVEKKVLVDNLLAQTTNLSAAVKETTLAAMHSGDMTTVVEQCFSIVSRRDGIAYIVVSQKDEDSLIFLNDKWFMGTIDPVLHKDEHAGTGRFLRSNLTDSEVYNYTSSLSYLGLELGHLYIGLKLDSYYAAQTRMYTANIATALGVLIIGFILSTIVAKKIVGPIVVLKNFVRNTVENGFDGQRVSIETDDEIEDLANVFNAMAGSIEDSRHKLQDAYDSMEERVELRTQELSIANQRLNLMFEMFKCCREGICITNVKGLIEEINPAFSQLADMRSEELKGKDPLTLLTQDDDTIDAVATWRNIRSHGFWEGGGTTNLRGISTRRFHLSVSAIYDRNGVGSHYIFILRDVSELKDKEDLIHHQVYHDSLTGLPNRKYISEHIHSLVANQKTSKKKMAVFFIDLDNFKHVNDNYGHTKGDQVLVEVGRRLKSVLRENDLVGRLGGDEFIVVLTERADRKIIELVVDKLMTAFDAEFAISDHVGANISMSCGIAIFPEDGISLDQLLANSDMAMYKAKNQGKQQAAFYDVDMHERVRSRYILEQKLKVAVENDELLLHYQPIVDNDGTIVRIEALVRWRTADGELLPPDQFIPVAEESDLINSITKVVVNKSFDQLAIWQAAGWTGILSINLSTRSLYNQNVISHITSLALSSGIRIENVELEVTETTIMYDISTAKSIINDLCAAGFSIALDDFGTGYSSLRYLADLPYHTLKIDKIFVDGLLSQDNRFTIISSIISLARGLNREVVAEGVETLAQATMLTDMNCHFLQGYYFSKPIPETEITKMIIPGLSFPYAHLKQNAHVPKKHDNGISTAFGTETDFSAVLQQTSLPPGGSPGGAM